jgi:hypothetical protein
MSNSAEHLNHLYDAVIAAVETDYNQLCTLRNALPKDPAAREVAPGKYAIVAFETQWARFWSNLVRRPRFSLVLLAHRLS